jgi:dihydrofolate synthase / folylpolyglutamate synthase
LILLEMTYEQAILFLDGRIGIGWKLRLDSMRNLLAELDNPHTQFKSVHIAGTNGKGSTAAMLESIYRAAGYKTGLYTSPHLLDVRERIQVNREHVLPEHFADLMQRIAPFIEKYGATYFEVLTALSFLYFAESNVDIAFIETGLGGRLDATNVILPILSIITSIDFDHTKHLGDTLEKIATEKAGIIKPGVPCLVGDLPQVAEEVVRQFCEKQNSAFLKAGDIYRLSMLSEKPGATQLQSTNDKFPGDMQLSLNGRHQLSNAAIAMTACELLLKDGFEINHQHISLGLSHINWSGRFEIVGQNPTIVLDVAHNPASIASLVDLLSHFYSEKKIYFVVGLMQDKDVELIVEKLAQIAYAVQPVSIDYDRALPAQSLRDKFKRYDILLYEAKYVSGGVVNVLQQCENASVVCITGSHYIAGEAMEKIKGLTS